MPRVNNCINYSIGMYGNAAVLAFDNGGRVDVYKGNGFTPVSRYPDQDKD